MSVIKENLDYFQRTTPWDGLEAGKLLQERVLSVARDSRFVKWKYKKVRIILVAPQPYSDIRATPMMNLRLTRMLADAGHFVDVLTYPFGTAADYPGVAVHRCRRPPFIKNVGIGFSPAKLVTDLSLACRSTSFPRKGFDVIHAVEEGVFIGIMMGRRMGIPVIYDMDSVLSHDVGASSLSKIPAAISFVRRAERWAVKNSEMILTITPTMAEHVRELDPSKKIAIVPDIPLPSPEGGPNKERALEQIPQGFIDGKIVIMYTGSSAEYQGLDILISAMPKIMTTNPNAVFLVIGGEENDLLCLKKQATEMGMMHNLLILGKKPPEEIPHFFSLADVLVSPRRAGVNPPAKIYTYMQSRVPIVASNIKAHTAVLGVDTATLTKPEPAALADGITWVLSHPEEASTRASRAQASVSEMTPESQARQILAAYEMVRQ